jgi:hypothetical protein
MPIIWKVGTGDLCMLLVANYREAIGIYYRVARSKERELDVNGATKSA